jgi:DNA-3-methyladenine glycosylase I
MVKKISNDKTRCWWCGDDPLYVRYHDEEWGRPVTDDIGLYEKICLEGFQAGLSWITILRKRENFRVAFAGFDFEKVAKFTQKDVERLLKNEGIIRHRGKIEAAIHNAKLAIAMREDFGSLYNYFKQFIPESDQSVSYSEAAVKARPAVEESHKLSKDLRKRGFKFVGPTTVYAHMQASGMVNDHVEDCHVRGVVEELRTQTAAKKKGMRS